MITLTAEQAQQIEEVLVTWFKSFPHQVDCNDNEALATIRAARAQEQAEQEPEYKGWYCAQCERGVDGSEVTFYEQHEACGRIITDDVPPKPVQQAEQELVAQQDSDDRRLLREIFMLCEATEELESTNDFMRGRIFEAKCIRRGIGTWYQDTFCGRSYMGEPVLNAAPVRTKDLTDDEILEINQYTTLQFARAVIAADKGNSK